MATLLVHVTTGPDDPTKAALSFLVARAALADGHRVNLFLAGEGVRLLSVAVLDGLEGVGTGKLREHYESIVSGGGRFYVSGMSARARGFDESLLEDRPAEFAMPDVLVQLLLKSDRSLTY